MVIGQGSHKQKTLSVTQNMVVRGMVVGEGGRSTGVLLYQHIYSTFMLQIIVMQITANNCLMNISFRYEVKILQLRENLQNHPSGLPWVKELEET